MQITQVLRITVIRRGDLEKDGFEWWPSRRHFVSSSFKHPNTSTKAFGGRYHRRIIEMKIVFFSRNLSFLWCHSLLESCQTLSNFENYCYMGSGRGCIWNCLVHCHSINKYEMIAMNIIMHTWKIKRRKITMRKIEIVPLCPF